MRHRYARGSVQVQQLDEVVFREPSTVGGFEFRVIALRVWPDKKGFR